MTPGLVRANGIGRRAGLCLRIDGADRRRVDRRELDRHGVDRRELNRRELNRRRGQQGFHFRRSVGCFFILVQRPAMDHRR